MLGYSIPRQVTSALSFSSGKLPGTYLNHNLLSQLDLPGSGPEPLSKELSPPDLCLAMPKLYSLSHCVDPRENLT